MQNVILFYTDVRKNKIFNSIISISCRKNHSQKCKLEISNSLLFRIFSTFDAGNFFSIPVSLPNRRDQFQAKTATQFFFSNTTRYLSKKKCRECINKEARQQIRTFLFCAYKKSWPRQTGLERPAESNTRGNWTMRIDSTKGFGSTVCSTTTKVYSSFWPEKKKSEWH